MTKNMMRSITALGLTLALVGFSLPAASENVSDVQARLDAEYQDGKVGASTYADLTDLLKMAQGSATSEDTASATESYNVLLDAMAGIAVDAEAAGRLRFN